MPTTSIGNAEDCDSSPAGSIACICAGAFLLVVNDALAKRLGASYPVAQVVFFRMLFALGPIVVVGLALGGRRSFATKRPLVHVGRGLLSITGTYGFFLGLTLLPLAETTAIAYTAPLFVTLLAAPLVGETPRGRQWLATVVGFLGMLLIVQPGGAAFSLAAAAPLTTAVAYALMMLSARRLGRSETIWASMLYATAIPLAISALLVLFVWQPLALPDLPWFAAMGLCGGAAMTLITQAFRIGQAAVVAPFDYTGLIWAVIFGWVFWSEIPPLLTLIGALLIAACGVYLASTQARAGSRRGIVGAVEATKGD